MKKIIFPVILIFLFGCTNRNEPSGMNAKKKDAKMKIQSGYANVHGLKMYYEIHGAGFPLLLIHGGGSTIESTFGRVIDQFAKDHKVIAVELQAHGHTQDIDRSLCFEQDADDVAELLSQLKVLKADIFGFSNGGSTTLQIAIRHPALVRKIIVASAFSKKSGAPSWFWDMINTATFEGMPKGLKEAFLKINPDSTALHRMYERDIARMQSFKDISDDDIKKIDVPAFIIIGDKDVVLPEHAVALTKMIRHSRLAIVPGGHGDYIGESTTPYDTTVVNGTISMIESFLKDEVK
jgi:pimeloyl-ACP methyl ester carboxylesterase